MKARRCRADAAPGQRHHGLRPQLGAALLGLGLLVQAAGAATAGAASLATLAADAASTAGSTLPDSAAVQRQLASSAALRGAQHGVAAEQAGRRQLQAGAQEWTAGLSTAQRQLGNGAVPARGNEWELSAQRPWRLPGKAGLADALGAARVDAAQADVARRWREQARALLDQQLAWLQARETATVWQAQLQLLSRQAQAVARRTQLGDAARIDQLQADAALALARAQAEQALSRTQAERQAMADRFGGLQPVDVPLAAPPAAPLPAARLAAALPAASLPDPDALLQASPEWRLAQLEARSAAALARADEAERRPDPSVGWRIGTGPNPGERVVGLSISLPLGGDHRAAGAQASEARRAAAEAAAGALRVRLLADATQLRLTQQRQLAHWQRQAEAADALGRAAQASARAYALGEGTLAEVLQAQRQANEQQLAAALAAVDAWAAVWRVALESGLLWAAPAGGFLAWLGLAWLGLAWLGLAWLGLAWGFAGSLQRAGYPPRRAGNFLLWPKKKVTKEEGLGLSGVGLGVERHRGGRLAHPVGSNSGGRKRPGQSATVAPRSPTSATTTVARQRRRRAGRTCCGRHAAILARPGCTRES